MLLELQFENALLLELQFENLALLLELQLESLALLLEHLVDHLHARSRGSFGLGLVGLGGDIVIHLIMLLVQAFNSLQFTFDLLADLENNFLSFEFSLVVESVDDPLA